MTLLPHGSVSQARALLRTADLGLVSLTPGVIAYAYPSKTATYLAEGLPLLVMVEPDSELALMVAREQVGHVLPRHTEGVHATLARLVDERDLVAAQREAATDLFDREFSSEVLLTRWANLLDDPRVA